MRKASIILAAVVALSAPVAGAQEKGATPQDVIQKVKQAASYLAQKKEAGLETFKQRQSEYVWADTYVFVIDCAQKKNAAHPLNPKLIGMDLSNIKEQTGKVIGPLFCEDHGGKGYWVEYQWPKAGEDKPSRKLTYVEPVPGTPYTVGAGTYDDTRSLADLEKMSGG
jgi:signal transduction histidine kinase